MSDRDRIEFYFEDNFLAGGTTSMTPDRGEFINIKKVTYKVLGRTYTLDYADESIATCMVCIIDLALAEEGEYGKL